MKRNRPATLALVGALHAAAIYALVVGLAGPVGQMFEDKTLVGEQIPLPKVPPPVPEAAKPDPARPQTAQAKPIPQEVFVTPITNILGHDDRIILPPFGGGIGGGDGTLTPPPPPQPQHQAFTPKLARPVGKPGAWVTPNDYPTADLRAEREGTTGFQLSIGMDGKVQSCQVTASSGSASLDAAACDKLTKRAKFAPATDATGTAVAGTYSSAVHWTIPKS
ncbi:MAG: energy transducer TonB [Novosphingobium sp.]